MRTKHIMDWRGACAVCITASALLAISCGRSDSFKLTGEIDEAGGKMVVLEKSDFSGQWIAVDSTRVRDNGRFEIKANAPASPEIYRLALDDAYIYLPVDSTEHITLRTNARHFASEFSLSGSRNAELMESFEKRLQRLQYSIPDSVEAFKRSVYTDYIKDGNGSIISYYVLTKTIGGSPLFDPADINDARYYAAVATQYMQYSPNDPHAKMLERVSMDAMRNRNSAQGKKTVVSANEIKMLEISLPDEKGNTRRLSDVAGHGKKCVVVFAMMNAPESPAFNRQLKALRDRTGIEYYHISFDEDRYQWRDAASNLPWTTVIDPLGTESNALRDYNVASVPVFFIYDGDGNLIDRADDFDQLAKKL